jgi:zinc protease
MAHLFEHLMFGQTRNIAPGELDRLIESTGGDTNASTWVDWTYYRDSLPASELELAARLESDRLVNLVLENEQIESEREVVINERIEHVDDDVDGFLDEQLHALAFDVHPYRWPTIGWMDDIRSLSKDQIQAFYDTYYAPNNATIVVVGDVDEQRALDTLARYYGDIAPSEIPSGACEPEPAQTAERRASFAKPVFADRAVIGYRSPAHDHADWPVLELIGTLLTGTPSSRLYRRLVVDTELASSADSGVSPFRDPSLFRFTINLTRGHRSAEVERELDEALGELRTVPVGDEELERFKSCSETDFWSAMRTFDGRADQLGHYETTLGDFHALFDMNDQLRTIDADDILRVANEYFDASQRTVVVAEPEADA